MLDLFWQLRQERDIAAAQTKANRAAATGRDALDQARDLESRLDALALTAMAMWSILEQKLGVTESDLEARMREIDLADGKLDGRPPKIVGTCESCRRVVSARHERCLYCGGRSLAKGPFVRL